MGRKAPKKPKKSWLSNIRLPSLRRPARKIKAKDQLQPPPPPPPSSVKKSSTELSAKPSNLKPTTAVVKENTNNNNRKKPPPVKKFRKEAKNFLENNIVLYFLPLAKMWKNINNSSKIVEVVP